MAEVGPRLREYFVEGEAAGARYRLCSPRRAPQGSAGSQLGRSAGSSLEFLDHRDYQPGDDLRQVDWAAYARTDKLTLKMYRQEVYPHVDVLLDASQSMDLPESAKLGASGGLAAALCTAGRNAGFGHRVYVTSPAYHEVAGSGRDAAGWSAFELRGDDDPVSGLRQMRPPWRWRSIRVVISDLLFAAQPKDLLAPLAQEASAVAVIQVVSEGDVAGPGKGNVRLVDSETGLEQELYIDEAAAELYRAGFGRHQAEWRQAAREVGAVFVAVTAEEICRGWDLGSLVKAELLDV